MGRTFQSQQHDKLDENRCKILEVHRSRSIDQVFVDLYRIIIYNDTYYLHKSMISKENFILCFHCLSKVIN